MLLPVAGEERAEGLPWIAVESLAVAARLPVRDYVGAEWITS